MSQHAPPHPPHAGSALPWLFIDIDATLLPHRGTVSARNRAAIRAWLDAGGHCSLATGKHPSAVRPLALELGLSGPHVSGNGTSIVTHEQCELLAHITPEVAALQAALRGQGVPHVCYTADHIFLDDRNVTRAQIDNLVSFGEPQPIEAIWTGDVFKILTFVEHDDEATEAGLRLLAEGTSLTCIRTGVNFVEFIPAASGKGVAAEAIMRRHQWPVAHSVAIGDSENDLSMMHHCGRAVAVANAVPAVLAIAHETVPSCQDDGVAVYLERLLAEVTLRM